MRPGHAGLGRPRRRRRRRGSGKARAGAAPPAGPPPPPAPAGPRGRGRPGRPGPPAAPRAAEAAAPVPGAWPATAAPLPRPAMPVAARHGLDAAPDLAEQVAPTSEHLEQAGVDVSRAPGRCRHHLSPPAFHDTITIYRQPTTGLRQGQVITR